MATGAQDHAYRSGPVAAAADPVTPRLARLTRLAAHTLAAPVAGLWLEGACVAAYGADRDALAALGPPAPPERDPVARTAAASAGYAFALGAPLTDGARPVDGALWVFDRAPRAPDPHARVLLDDLAALAGALCAQADAEPARDAREDRARETAVEAERMRVRFEAIFENTDAVVFIKRRSGELLAANRRYLELAGRADVVGRTDHEIYGPETGDALRARDRALFESGKPFTGEERVILPDGREVIYLSSKFLIRDPALNDMVLCGIATDITAQKRLQASLEASTRAAEQAALAKAQFLAAMSHEIRTPMNGVLGMLALLATTPLDDRQRAMALTARDSASGLMKMLGDILDYARLDTHELTMSRIPFDLRETLEAAAAQARPAAARKGLTLAVTAADAPRRLTGDPARVRQVLGALLDNAVKFTERGGVRIEAEACADAPRAAAFLRVTVRDTGPGVTGAPGVDVFAGFTQGDASSTRRHGGVGLGLTLARRMVEAMGGAIGYRNDARGGAAFWFTLPLNPDAQSA
ncbi:MAG: PAS domain-containing protein [Alphaproteobacteria bacterium]|nr:PAS domain-containing protein [Alphaproteobacteria bacterium]